jgi:hypothetical protein
MGMRIIVLTFVCLWALHVSGQELVFSEPVKLGSQMNSDDEELAPMLSSDGKTLYFSRAFHANNIGGKYAGTDIWVSKKDAKGNWMPAANMSNQWNNKRSNAVIGVNHDHTVVYLLNAYSNKSGISFSKLNSGIWGKPEFIPIPGFNRDDFVGIYVHPDFDVIMISMRGVDSNGEEDLYVSLKDSFGNWIAPKNLGPTINTKGFEISPFLSLDKSKLFFTSSGHGGYGDGDVHVSERLYDAWDIWSVPRNLGDKINTPGFDAYFSIYADTLAFFACSLGGKTMDIFKLPVSYFNNVLPPGSKFFTSEELNEIYPQRLSTRLDFTKGKSTLSSDQNEIVWFVANRVLSKSHIHILIWVREEEDSKNTIERTAEIIRALKLVGFEESRIAVSTERAKPEVSKSGGGVIEILLFR